MYLPFSVSITLRSLSSTPFPLRNPCSAFVGLPSLSYAACTEGPLSSAISLLCSSARPEINTANLIFDKLDNNRISYSKAYFRATKTQLVITSTNLSYVTCF